ncbi:MAG: hypothetical protein Q7S11_04730 [bacterium]|nr:hypothetical protein [bacterium]
MFNTISSIALLLISGGIAFMFITPKYDDIITLRSNSAELSSALAKAEDIGNISKDLSDAMRSLPREGLEKLERILPLQFDDLRFINDLQGVGERSGLKIQGITTTGIPINVSADNAGAQQLTPGRVAPTVGATAESTKYVAHKFSFTVVANYDQFIVFLKDLERSLEFIDIDSISLTTSSAPKGTSEGYNYQVELTTYSLK